MYFVHDLINADVRERNDKQTWEMWLHKVQDESSYEDWLKKVVTTSRGTRVNKEAVSGGIKESFNILNNFKPS